MGACPSPSLQTLAVEHPLLSHDHVRSMARSMAAGRDARSGGPRTLRVLRAGKQLSGWQLEGECSTADVTVVCSELRAGWAWEASAEQVHGRPEDVVAGREMLSELVRDWTAA